MSQYLTDDFVRGLMPHWDADLPRPATWRWHWRWHWRFCDSRHGQRGIQRRLDIGRWRVSTAVSPPGACRCGHRTQPLPA
jgi:hypothetical protein